MIVQVQIRVGEGRFREFIQSTKVWNAIRAIYIVYYVYVTLIYFVIENIKEREREREKMGGI